MKYNHLLLVVSLSVSSAAWATPESMPNMPLIKPKTIYTVPTQEAGDELLEQRGYGDQEPMVRMMNLMMVGGSGYEGMDMGEMTADAKSAGATPSHGGHGHGHTSAPPVPSPAEGQSATFDFDAKITPTPPQVGPNILDVGVQLKNGAKPAKGLKIRAQVYMTNMDMGTAEPKVREVAPGKYQVKVVFSMKGPWAVKLLLPESAEKVLNYEVGAAK